MHIGRLHRPSRMPDCAGRAQPWQFQGLRQAGACHDDCADRPGRARAAARPAASRAQRRAAVHCHGCDAGRRGTEAQGHKVIHMEVGQPGTPAPRAALEAVKRALDSETLGYTMALGLPALRERIARHYRRALRRRRCAGARGGDDGILGRLRAGVPGPVRRRRQGGAAVAGLSLLPPHPDGARPDARPPRDRCRRRAGCRPRRRSTRRQARSALPGSSSPARPTRRAPCWSRAGLPRSPRPAQRNTHLAGLRRDLPRPDLRHAPRRRRSPTPTRRWSINSFSKYFSMTGWRVGWLVVPDALVRPIERLAQNLYISPPAVAQVAAHRRLRWHR